MPNTNTYLSGKIIQDKKDVVLSLEQYMNGIITPVAVVKNRGLLREHLPTRLQREVYDLLTGAGS